MRRRPLTPFARAAAFVAALAAGASCVSSDAAPPDADSTVDTLAAESSLDDKSGDASDEAVAIVQQSQQSQQSRIGRLQLLGDPQSGSCSATGDPAIGVRYTYEGDWPMRTVTLEMSDATPRGSVRMFEVQSTQRTSGYDETEAIYVLFDADGGIQQGRRRYFSSEAPPAREEAPLLAADSASISQLAAQVLAWCRRPSPAR